MSWLRRLAFSLSYLGRPPWDTNVVPPEVVDYIAAHSPGRALDLGCGSGTSSLALAKAGWSVTGVDFARRAIRAARRKAKNANVEIEFILADVIHYPSPLFAIPYSLVLDVGCFHALSSASKAAYLNQLDRLLASAGDWLLYSFLKPEHTTGPGLTVDELESIAKQFKLLRRKDGRERNVRPSAWLWFEKQ